ncbi:hypothetical protein [Sphingobacterium mizutaii]|uniref:hypothetical protein n=1 Tax=Sphingobacterium mizutaii TaxID=1010 RepID=UPI001626318C|nr:hypothetical protein [Sphingobacterium mizutaii]MBV2228066.1 hypothetical protein [Sphingobacterium mizutaii]
MRTELENLQQQVNTLEENTELITQDIVRIMPTIISLLSDNEKNMKDLHEIRAKDQELLRQIQIFMKSENDVLSKIVKDYDSLQNLAIQIADATGEELNKLVDKEKEIVSKLAEIPDQVNIKHHYGIDMKSTPVIIVMIVLSVIISLGLGTLYEKNRQLADRKSYEIRYRMMKLELPNITSHIDSTYSLDPDKFHALVIKREEENKLLNSIERKRKEIENLSNSE